MMNKCALASCLALMYKLLKIFDFILNSCILSCIQIVKVLHISDCISGIGFVVCMHISYKLKWSKVLRYLNLPQPPHPHVSFSGFCKKILFEFSNFQEIDQSCLVLVHFSCVFILTFLCCEILEKKNPCKNVFASSVDK